MLKIDTGRKLYTITEMYKIVNLGFRSVPRLRGAAGAYRLNPDFRERIMLAVTEVNGCEICSYAHTRMALEAGISNEEIRKMLSGVMTEIPLYEAEAVCFAQHYADSRGCPSEASWKRMKETYGLDEADAILAAIRMIMLGNALGIPWSSFFNRLKGRPDPRSSLLYELSVILPGSLLFIVAALAGFFVSLPWQKVSDPSADVIEYEDWFRRNDQLFASESEAIRLLLPTSGTGIEIGVGSGIFVSELGISYGVEPSLDRAAAARKKGIRVYHGVAENPPVEEAAYQYALMVTVDCFLSDLPRAFSEVWRILNDGGIFVIAVLDRATPLGEEYEKNKHKYKSYRDASFHSAEEIIRCLEEVGFTVTGKQQTVYSLENSF